MSNRFGYVNPRTLRLRAAQMNRRRTRSDDDDDDYGDDEYSFYSMGSGPGSSVGRAAFVPAQRMPEFTGIIAADGFPIFRFYAPPNPVGFGNDEMFDPEFDRDAYCYGLHPIMLEDGSSDQGEEIEEEQDSSDEMEDE